VELLEIADFRWGNGLPATSEQVAIIERLREHRAWKTAYDAMSKKLVEEGCGDQWFNNRYKWLQKREWKDWIWREEQIRQYVLQSDILFYIILF
jgi:hypothetical protein